jgi:uncharacterized protein
VASFEPLFRHPHLQTIASHYWPRPRSAERFPVTRRLVPTEPGIQVLLQSQQPAGEARGEIVMVHGLEGSGEAGYIESLAGAALDGGFAAHRFHMRTCGGTEPYANTLYHAGLTSDLAVVLRMLRAENRVPIFVVGFSLGGNVVLKLAGELGESAVGLIGAVCAVSTPLDLAACSCRIDAPENFLYQYRFVRRMRARLCASGRYQPADFAGLRSVRAIDDRITAPSFGFGNAANYYRTQSALGFLAAIRVPTLLIQSKDDPLVPYAIFERLPANPAIELLATPHGGHLGFLGQHPHRFWLDDAVMGWIRGAATFRTSPSA